MNSPVHFTTLDEVLKEALRRERRSQEFYAQMACTCHVEMVRELLERLEDEEHKHVRMLEAMATNLRLGHDLMYGLDID